MYITRDHLNALNSAAEQGGSGWELVGRSAATLGVAFALGTTVGYRDAAGKPSNQTMPSLGPVPLDLGVFGVGHLLGLFAPGGQYFHAGADGGGAVFTMTAGQSIGRKLYEKMKKKEGAGAAPRGQTEREAPPQGGYRDAFGKYRNAGALPSPKDLPASREQREQVPAGKPRWG